MGTGDTRQQPRSGVKRRVSLLAGLYSPLIIIILILPLFCLLAEFKCGVHLCMAGGGFYHPPAGQQAAAANVSPPCWGERILQRFQSVLTVVQHRAQHRWHYFSGLHITMELRHQAELHGGRVGRTRITGRPHSSIYDVDRPQPRPANAV